MLTKKNTVGEIVTRHPNSAAVLEKYKIDYCCGGKRPFLEACAKKGLDSEEIWTEISDEIARADAVDSVNWVSKSMSELADHIEQTHHVYVTKTLSHLETLVTKVSGVHGETHPELKEVESTFRLMKDELESHMMKEERILFPIIRQLESTTGPIEFHCGSVQNPIRVMVTEHDSTGEALKTIRALTSDYTLPEGACTSYRVLFNTFKEFEKDLHMHIHKENNILFLKVIAAEASRQMNYTGASSRDFRSRG